MLAAPLLVRAWMPVRPLGPLFPVPLVPVDSSVPRPVVADLDRDGRADVVVADRSMGVSVLRGRGDGTFDPGRHVEAGLAPVSVSLDDFNGDGIMDLAVARESLVICSFYGGCHDMSGGVSVLLGRGDGTFGPASDYDAGYSPALIAAGDFNGDGRADLTVASITRTRCDETPCITHPGQVTLLLGNGDGTFETGPAYFEGEDAKGLAVADLDGDGTQDLVAAFANKFVCGPSDCTVTPAPIVALLGSAEGRLRPLEPIPLNGPLFALVAADFDGDGRVDLVVDGSILYGLGDGTFSPPAPMGVFPGSNQVAAVDVNDDGRMDLVAGRPFSNDVGVFLGDGRGGFAPPMIFGAVTAIDGLAFGDFDGDGKTDLLLGSGPIGAGPSPEDPPGALAILFGTGDGRFLAPARYLTGDGASPIALADFDGDRHEDVAAATAPGRVCDLAGCRDLPASVAILIGRSDGSLAPALRTEVGGQATAFVAADFNGDRRADLAVALGVSGGRDGTAGAEPAGDVAILFGNGDGTFGAPLYLEAVACPSSMVAGDFDGDRRIDLVTVDTYATCPTVLGTLASGGAAILLGNGDGTFRPARRFDAGEFPARLAAGRLDDNRSPDLVVTHLPALDQSSAPVSILLGRGDGTFSPSADLALENQPLAIAIGDLDGDRKADLALGAGWSVAVLRGDGAGGFGPAAFYRANGGIATLTIGDFDADGTPDLAAASSGSVALLPGRGDGRLGPPARFGAGGPAVAIAGGDFDGDSLEDIVVTTCASGLSGFGRPIGGGRGGDTCSGPTGVSVLLNRLWRACDGHCRDGGGPPAAVPGRAAGSPSLHGSRSSP
jgi:hypothetical protein